MNYIITLLMLLISNFSLYSGGKRGKNKHELSKFTASLITAPVKLKDKINGRFIVIRSDDRVVFLSCIEGGIGNIVVPRLYFIDDSIKIGDAFCIDNELQKVMLTKGDIIRPLTSKDKKRTIVGGGFRFSHK